MAVYVDFESELALNWDPRLHLTHKPIHPNSWIWGLNIIDWDSSFTTRLTQFTTADLSIPFQYLENIPNWDKTADWKDVGEIMGRFEPAVTYASSGGQDMTFSLIYHAEAFKNGDNVRTHWTMENIEIYAKRLQSLVYPQYDGRYGPPLKLYLNIGNMFKNVPLIVKQVSMEHQAPYDTLTGLPKMRKITISARVSYPMYQGISQIQVYSAYEQNNSKYAAEVFAVEKLDPTWQPGSSTGNPYDSAFSNYS